MIVMMVYHMPFKVMCVVMDKTTCDHSRLGLTRGKAIKTLC